MDREEDLISRIQEACRGSPLDKTSLCRLMCNQLRTVLNHTGAVVQLRSSGMPIHIIGFDVTPRFARALRLAQWTVMRGVLLSKTDCQFAVHVDRLRALPLGLHLRPLVQGHLVVSTHSDAEQAWQSLFAFVGVPELSPPKLRRVLQGVTSPLHRAFFGTYKQHGVGLPTLTYAEVAICRMILDGASNKKIARALNKSPATVRNQLHAIFPKLGVSTRSAAAAVLKEMELEIFKRDCVSRRVLAEHLYY